MSIKPYTNDTSKCTVYPKQGLLDHVTVLIGIAVGKTAVAGVIHQPYWNYKKKGTIFISPLVNTSNLKLSLKNALLRRFTNAVFDQNIEHFYHGLLMGNCIKY